MSESAVDGDTGDTGVVDPGPDAATGTDAEDADAEAQLHALMQEQDPEELAKQVAHWRRVAQRHEKTARTHSAAAAELQQIKDAGKTELQRAQDALSASEQRALAADMRLNRLMAAAAHDLPPDLIDFLGDGTADELVDRAEQLSGFINDAARKIAEQMLSAGNGGRVPQATTSRPVMNMRPGAAPAGSTDTNPEALFRNLLGSRDNRD